jgi:tetratricopeptide (TPR) repeat protein
MTSRRFRAPLAAIFLAATASVALLASPALAADTPHLTRSVNNALAEAQKAANKGDLNAAKEAVDKARGVDDRTDYDNYMINEVALAVAIKMNDMAAADAAAEAAADSPALPDDQKANALRTALILANNQKHFDKAIAYAKQLEAMNSTDPVVQTAITQAYYLGKDYPNALNYTQKRIAAIEASGKKPDRQTLQILLDIQVAQQDEDGAEKTLEQLVAQFNDPKDWTQMIDVAMSSKGLRDVEVIWLGRLLFQTGATASKDDASLVGSTASRLTFFGDAEVAQQHGGADFPDPTARAAADKKTIQAQIKAGEKQGGQYNAKLAEALYSYGMYPEAEAAAKLAMQKGGAKDPTEPPMVLGQSLVAEGKYDDAIAAFNQVQGGGPATARITRLWVDFANIKKNPPVPETAAAAPAK